MFEPNLLFLQPAMQFFVAGQVAKGGGGGGGIHNFELARNLSHMSLRYKLLKKFPRVKAPLDSL